MSVFPLSITVDFEQRFVVSGFQEKFVGQDEVYCFEKVRVHKHETLPQLNRIEMRL